MHRPFAPLLLITLLAGLLTTASGQPTEPAPSRAEAMAAIDTLEKRFLSADAIKAADVVNRFVELSEDVLIVLDPDAMPWAAEMKNADPNDPETMLRALLTAAYFAGNARAQLETRKVEDMPYPGWKFVLRAYREARQKLSITINSLEDLGEMEKKGTLQRHERILKARRESGPAAPPEIIED